MGFKECRDPFKLAKSFPQEGAPTKEWVDEFYAHGHRVWCGEVKGCEYLFGIIVDGKGHLFGWVHTLGRPSRFGFAHVAVWVRSLIRELEPQYKGCRFYASSSVQLGAAGIKLAESIGLPFEGIVHGYLPGGEDAFMFGRKV